MAKTDKTKYIERVLWKNNIIQGLFGCFEVTIGWYGDEIVDFMTYKTNGEFRCYEIKVSKSDFNSGAKLSFHGDFNYYVMPVELYEKLKEDAEKEQEFSSFKTKDLFKTRLKNQGIGLIAVGEHGIATTEINAKRKPVTMGNRSTLLESMTRSLNREVRKFYKIKGYWEDKVIEG
ncbi:hypothetical protein AB6831_04200 [Carnobacterium divergens]|uniref:hypothetical protein n=1 Tax=Carnobacterium divergens TaxID=2748 RepID=UPI0039C99A68